MRREEAPWWSRREKGGAVHYDQVTAPPGPSSLQKETRSPWRKGSKFYHLRAQVKEDSLSGGKDTEQRCPAEKPACVWALISGDLPPWGIRQGHRNKELQRLWTLSCLFCNHWVIISMTYISHLTAKHLVSVIITGSYNFFLRIHSWFFLSHATWWSFWMADHKWGLDNSFTRALKINREGEKSVQGLKIQQPSAAWLFFSSCSPSSESTFGILRWLRQNRTIKKAGEKVPQSSIIFPFPWVLADSKETWG